MVAAEEADTVIRFYFLRVDTTSVKALKNLYRGVDSVQHTGELSDRVSPKTLYRTLYIAFDVCAVNSL